MSRKSYPDLERRLSVYDLAGGICFDPACQKAADSAFVIAISLPLLVLVLAIVYLFGKAADTEQVKLLSTRLTVIGDQIVLLASWTYSIMHTTSRCFSQADA